jgi:hypothetical protein
MMRRKRDFVLTLRRRRRMILWILGGVLLDVFFVREPFTLIP